MSIFNTNLYQIWEFRSDDTARSEVESRGDLESEDNPICKYNHNS